MKRFASAETGAALEAQILLEECQLEMDNGGGYACPSHDLACRQHELPGIRSHVAYFGFAILRFNFLGVNLLSGHLLGTGVSGFELRGIALSQ